jgi:hypothetical protein
MPLPDHVEPSHLQSAIDKILLKLVNQDPASEEYAKGVNQLSALYKLKELDKPEPPQRISPDTLVLAATNIAGIILVIKHEHFNVITSKAFSFIRPAR